MSSHSESIDQYSDASEFEARVAAKLVQYIVKPPKCSEMIRGVLVHHCRKGVSPVTCIQKNAVAECMLRRARIEVEQEMLVEKVKLLPCPVCNSTEYLKFYSLRGPLKGKFGKIYSSIRCEKCSYYGPSVTNVDLNMYEEEVAVGAKKLWNMTILANSEVTNV